MLIVNLTSGVTIENPVTLSMLQDMWDDGYGKIDGELETADLGDAIVTAAKLAATLNLASHTITLPDKFSAQDPITPASTVPDAVGQIGLDSSDIAYVAFGTSAGNWVQIGNADVVTSIAATPTRIGQLALVSDALYIATATASAADWEPIYSNAVRMPDQAGDHAGIANNITVFCKDNAGTLELYYRRGTAAAQQLTGVVGTAVAGAGSPDWDSGWSQVTKNTTYDLLATTVTGSGPYYGGFSMETKGTSYGAAWGVGNANDLLTDVFSPAQGAWGFRICHMYIRRNWDGVGGNYYDEVMIPASSVQEIYHGQQYGMWLFWDDGAGGLKLQTAEDGVFRGFKPTAGMDWATDLSNDALVRIKVWV